MNTKEFLLFLDDLFKDDIIMSEDLRQKDDGTKLENYLFEKDDEAYYIAKEIIDRRTGQSHIFVPTSSKKKGENFKVIPLTDKEFLEQWAIIIKLHFGIKK